MAQKQKNMERFTVKSLVPTCAPTYGNQLLIIPKLPSAQGTCFLTPPYKGDI